jgi:hypothetical protein
VIAKAALEGDMKTRILRLDRSLMETVGAAYCPRRLQHSAESVRVLGEAPSRYNHDRSNCREASHGEAEEAVITCRNCSLVTSPL